MVLTFKDALPANPDRDGMDVKFVYTTDLEPDIPKIFHAVGSTNSWNMSGESKLAYSYVLFTAVVNYIKRYWNSQHELPKENVQFYEGKELAVNYDKATIWKDYPVILE